MATRTALEGIYDAILHSKGEMVTVYLSDGFKFEGLLEGMTYFNEGDKQKERPRMIWLKQGEDYIYIDSIRISSIKRGSQICNAKSAKKK
jgi:sRNA-binding regulator protein Hfq